MLRIREPFQSRVSVVEQPFLTNLRTYNFTNAKHGTSTCIVAYTHFLRLCIPMSRYTLWCYIGSVVLVVSIFFKKNANLLQVFHVRNLSRKIVFF